MLSHTRVIAPGGRGTTQLTLVNAFPIVELQVRLADQTAGRVLGTELRDVTGVGFSVPAALGSYRLTVYAKDSEGCDVVMTAARNVVVQ